MIIRNRNNPSQHIEIDPTGRVTHVDETSGKSTVLSPGIGCRSMFAQLVAGIRVNEGADLERDLWEAR